MELADPGVGRSRGIGRGGLADPSCAAEAVFRDRARRSSWILASGAAEGLGEVDSRTRRAQPRQFLGIGRDRARGSWRLAQPRDWARRTPGPVVRGLFGIRPLWKVGFGDLPSRNGASPPCHYKTRPIRENAIRELWDPFLPLLPLSVSSSFSGARTDGTVLETLKIELTQLVLKGEISVPLWFENPQSKARNRA